MKQVRRKSNGIYESKSQSRIGTWNQGSIEEVWYEESGKILNKSSYKFDDLGNKIEYIMYDTSAEPYLKYEYIFFK